MTTDQVKKLMGRRVLVKIEKYDEDYPIETCIRDVSPSGSYIKLGEVSGYFSERVLGWIPVSDIKVEEVLS